MGNKESSESLASSHYDDDERQIQTPKQVTSSSLPPLQQKKSTSKDSLEHFQKLYKKLNLEGFQRDDISVNINEIIYTPGTTILQNGSPALGIYVIKDGCCLVVASDGETVIRQLRKDNYFGEVSTIFKIPCTCSVVVAENSDCNVLFLDISHINDSIKEGIPSMQSWFIEQKYLDTSTLFPSDYILESLVKKHLSESHLFYNWSEEALLELMGSFPRQFIEIHQPGTYICYEGDDDMSAFLLLNGAVELFKNEKFVICLETTSSGCILFSEENLLYNDSTKEYTIKTSQTCQIVSIHQEYFTSIVKNYPVECAQLMALNKLWQSFLEDQLDDMDIKNTPNVHPNILACVLKKTKLFRNAAVSLLQEIVLKMVFLSFEENSVIIEHTQESDDQMLILLVAGTAAVITPSSNAVAQLKAGDLFHFTKFPSNCRLVSRSSSVVGKINKSVIKNMLLDHEADFEIVW